VVRTQLPVVACTIMGVTVIGRFWEPLTKMEKDAVLAHEQAHQQLHHGRQRWWWLLTGRWNGVTRRCHQQEHDADKIATFAGHGRGLLKLLGRAHNTPASDFHPSHRERMGNIMYWMTYGDDSVPENTC